MNINNDVVKKILVDELDYEEHEATTFLNSFPEIHEQLIPAVQQWIKDRSIVDTEFKGIKISDVMENNFNNFLLVIELLNKLYDDDLTEEQEKLLIKHIRSSKEVL